LPEAAEDAHTALKLARQIRYAAGEAAALTQLSHISMYADQPEDAVKWAMQAQRVPDDQIPDRGVRRVKETLPWALVVTGRLGGLTTEQLATLEAQCAQVLALAASAGDPGQQADTHYVLAMPAMKTGRLAEAGASSARSGRTGNASWLHAAPDRHPRRSRLPLRRERTSR
jgi:hypothetical protein